MTHESPTPQMHYSSGKLLLKLSIHISNVKITPATVLHGQGTRFAHRSKGYYCTFTRVCFSPKNTATKTQTQNSAYTVIVSLNTRIAVGKTFLWLLLNDIVIIMLPLENMFSLWMPTVQGGIYTSDVSSPPQAVL